MRVYLPGSVAILKIKKYKIYFTIETTCSRVGIVSFIGGSGGEEYSFQVLFFFFGFHEHVCLRIYNVLLFAVRSKL